MAAAFVLGEVYAAGYRKEGFLISLLALAVLYISGVGERMRRQKTERNILIMILCLCCFCAGSFRICAEEKKRAAIEEEAAREEKVILWARVDGIKQTAYGCAVTLSRAELLFPDDEKRLEEMKLYAYLSSPVLFMPGDWIQAEGTLRDFEGARNPGEFDSLSYYRSLGFHCAADISELIYIRKAAIPVGACLTMIREQLCEVFSQICSAEANGIYQAMLLGEKAELEEEIKELYSEGGISHILAISGLHMAVIGMGMYKIFRRFSGFSLSGLLAGALLSLYVLLTGSAVSACRAGIMFVVQLFSFICRRSYDMLSAASASLIFILWSNPMYLFHSGCQLSFGAVFAIGLVCPVLEKTVQTKNPVYQAFLSSVSVSFVTFPIQAWNFYELSLYSILLNLFVIPCMTVVMLSGILGGVSGMAQLAFAAASGCGLQQLWAGRFFVALGQSILKLYGELCRLTELLPGHKIVTGRPEVWVIFVYYALLVTGVLYMRKQKERKISVFWNVCRILAMLAVLTAVLCIRIQTGIYVCVVDVSQGDGIYIETPEIKILVDGGSTDKKDLYKDTLLPFLKARGVVKLDYAIVSHPDTDHVSGLKELLEKQEIAVSQLVLPEISENMWDDAYRELMDSARQSDTQVRTVSEGDAMHCGSLQINCLYPYEGLYTDDRNAYSTVLEVSYDGFDMLLTGDIGAEAEQYLVSYLEKTEKTYELLKVAHHGSRASSCRIFLDTLRPQLAVISCGQHNRYGHPHEETLKRLEETGCTVRRTDREGAVQFSLPERQD